MARHKEFDKQEVLEKAILIFWQKGYEATSVRDLIGAMGISSSSLYETFGDKRAVYILALRAYCEREQANFQEMLDFSQHPKKALELAFTTAREQIHGSSSQGLFSINSIVEFGNRDEEITKILWEHYQGIWQVFYTALATAQANGKISKQSDMGAVAHTILTTIYGYASILRVKPDFHDGNDVLASLQSLLD